MSGATGMGAGEPSSPLIAQVLGALSDDGNGANGGTLSPPHMHRTLSASPGATSDFSNEAVGGHNVGVSGNMMSTFAHQFAMNSASTSATSGGPSSTRVVRGGFDVDQSNASTPMQELMLEYPDDLESHPIYHPQGTGNGTTYNGAASPSMQSESVTAVGDLSLGNSSTTQMQHSDTSETQISGNVLQQPAATNGAAPIDEVISTTFDESTLRALCDMDCGMPLLYERIKQSMLSTNQASTFFKKRAAIEEEYSRSLIKLAKSSAETYATSEAKAGTYVNTWQSFMRTHEVLGDNRLRFSQKLSEMSDELSNLSKEVDKNRKYARDTGLRLERNLTDAEMSVEKSRHRFDSAAEELERLLLIKSGESAKGGELQGSNVGSSGPSGKRTLGKAIGKSGLLFKNKNPQQMLRQEEEIRSRTSNASDAFRKEVLSTQGIRQEYFNLQLPRILRSLKESSEEIDNGLMYHMARYAFLFESTVLGDGMAITPVSTVDGSVGLKAAVEGIDNRADFKTFMQNYSVIHGRDNRGPRREGPYEEGFVPTMPGIANKQVGNAAASSSSPKTASFRSIFGVPLAEQMARDEVEIPPILAKCAEAIEIVGLENVGIYRLSGTTSKVQKLKHKFDLDWKVVDLMNDEAINDINIVAGCLKLWFRELPEPLMTWDLYQGFIDAAKLENDRMRHIRMHEKVNDLPDANYATLKYLMGHLDKIRSQEAHNQMSASNLAIVFGPTLLSPPPPPNQDPSNAASAGAASLQDMSYQCKAIETILERYAAIFVDEGG
ncbi:hypothetical protein CBS101457_005393 [Exobasidium rhododendri]|nr:hypothetical protein CBS101457_005393 [Exobasidium rhododendri]